MTACTLLFVNNSTCEKALLTSKTISLEAAIEIAKVAVETAKKHEFNPITVVVLDASGNTVVSHRMDGCPALCFPKYAHAKASTAIGMGMSSRTFRAKYVPPGSTVASPEKFGQMISMTGISGGNIAPFPGGVLIKLKSTGEVIGAVGVSGATGDEDEFCAIMGCGCLDFVETEPKQHSCSTVKFS
jgi:uncharacterized protein GlcG (DUF336 family)